VRDDLAILSRSFHAGTIRLLGGEPLLHPKISEIAAVARASGVADHVCLVTNGMLLPRAPRELWESVDMVEISFYPGHEIEEQSMSGVLEILRSAGVELTAMRVSGFREPYSAQGTTDEGLIRRIYNTCQIAHQWGCHSVQDGYFYKCPLAHLIPAYGAMDRHWSATEDGVRLDDEASLFDSLTAYLLDSEPLQACAYCLGSVGKLFPHEIIARTGWHEPNKKTVPELIDWQFLESLETMDPNADGGTRTTAFALGPDSPSEPPPTDCTAASAPRHAHFWDGMAERLLGRTALRRLKRHH
jgi:hypothetical protein